MSTTQFLVYGKQHFTQVGYRKHAAGFAKPDVLGCVDLSGKCFVVTGANKGLGKEIVRYLAERKGKVYMICRNRERAENARKEILEEAQASAENVLVMVGDCGEQKDMVRVAAEIDGKEPNGVDALVCCAGVLLNERRETSDGMETTLAVHLVSGSYLLARKMEPTLRRALARGREPRVVFMSSGGMLNTAFPPWETAASIPAPGSKVAPKYDGQMAYAYAKRGQVLLAEQWAVREKSAHGDGGIAYVSVHPGWTKTDAVDSAFGDNAKYLEPLRTTEEGADGACWLAVAPRADLEPGAFYLDRRPQKKHIAGPFFTEGSFTKNSHEQVAAMMRKLEESTAQSF